MKLLRARRVGPTLEYVVHLDESKTIPDPNWRPPLIDDADNEGQQVPDPKAEAPQVPDPDFVLETSWTIDPPRDDESEQAFERRVNAYEATCRGELRLLAEHRLAALTSTGGHVLAGEGQAL